MGTEIRDRVLGSVGLYLTVEHKKRRQIQLSFFLLAFFLIIGSYGGVMVIAFSGLGSELLNDLISTWKLAI